MVQSVKCLPYKHEDLNSSPRLPIMMEHILSPVLGRQREEDIWGSQSSILVELQARRDPASQEANNVS